MKDEGAASKAQASDRFFNGVAKLYEQDSRYESPPTDCTNIATVSYMMSAEEASIITLYNGVDGCPSSKVKLPNGKIGFKINPWTFDPKRQAGSRWTYSQNGNNYLREVIAQTR
ncbi:hypothetical protein BH11VER1_BH11VER1_39970 [soil metagenome]